MLENLAAEREARAAAQDRRAWRRARDADTIGAYNRYIENRPDGAFVNWQTHGGHTGVLLHE